MSKRQIAKSIITFILIATIAVTIVGIAFYYLPFVEGRTNKKDGCSIVTATQDWLVYEGTSTLQSPIPVGAINDFKVIFFENDLVSDYVTDGEKINIRFSHKVVVSNGDNEKIFYFVEVNEVVGYYITDNEVNPTTK